MQALARNGYTTAQVRAALHAPIRHFKFSYDLLNSGSQHKRTLTNVLSGSVSNNALAEIKRTARFTIRDQSDIDFLQDRIKPWAWLRMFDDGFAKFSLGVFLLSTPARKIGEAHQIIREIEAYDLLKVLVDDKVTARYVVPKGTNYITEISDILTSGGLKAQNLTPTTKVLPALLEWPIGTNKLKIVNDLLAAINYKSLTIDPDGVAVTEPYVSPASRASEYTYATDSDSVILAGVEDTVDYFSIPNKWIGIVSEAERTVLTSTYTNSNANSLTSTVSRGRTIVKEPFFVDAPDQETLDEIVQRQAFEDSQIYQKISMPTGIMPMHGDLDVLTLVHHKLGISAKFSETAWEMPLKSGATMTHELRRVVSV